MVQSKYIRTLLSIKHSRPISKTREYSEEDSQLLRVKSLSLFMIGIISMLSEESMLTQHPRMSIGQRMVKVQCWLWRTHFIFFNLTMIRQSQLSKRWLLEQEMMRKMVLKRHSLSKKNSMRPLIVVYGSVTSALCLSIKKVS